MLRIHQSLSGEGAVRYFDSALKISDYYTKEHGTWGGLGAERLGLSGTVERKHFVALALNKLPFDPEERWTARTNTTRIDPKTGKKTKSNRRAGYDFCWSVPKSVSLYLAETKDQAVEEMVIKVFLESMSGCEEMLDTRVRKGDAQEDRRTGNMTYAWFIHRETRPVAGVPDPHFHIHAFVFNGTYDKEEERWKAGQFGEIKADSPFYQAAFNARLAQELTRNGYGIRRTERSFELASVPAELKEKFSKRTQQIEETARREHTILSARARALAKTKGMDYTDAYEEVKSELGAQTREQKSANNLNPEQLLAHWRSEMTEQERACLQTEAVKAARSEGIIEDSSLVEDLAVDHMFQNSSVIRPRHAAAHVLKFGIGSTGVYEALDFAMQDPRFINVDGKLATTREVLDEEESMMATIHEGRGAHPEIGRGGAYISELASYEQQEAIDHLLRSKDLVTSIQGPAGSGKTTMMKEAVRAIESLSGRRVVTLAPSSSAVGVLHKDDFASAGTLQMFMLSQLAQDAAKGQILWVDEAGFLSAREMRWCVKFAAANDCRLILSGDTEQHHGVERGDALRVMEVTAAVSSARLSTIFRQKAEDLRAAIQSLSEGKTEQGFDQLDTAGVIEEEEDPDKRRQMLVGAHLSAVRSDISSLIVAPTHAECRALASDVRKELRAQGLLGETEVAVQRLETVNLSDAEKRDSIRYELGQVIEFHQRVRGGFKAGEQWKVVHLESYFSSTGKVWISKDGGPSRVLPKEAAKRFGVYRIASTNVAAGDQVRVTKNFKSNGIKFSNNELLKVTGVEDDVIQTSKGSIEYLSRPVHIDQGIAVTSHASQGKTVDQVLVSAPVEAFSQTNKAQFYVSMSRARLAMRLWTDSKAALKEAVMRPSRRVSPYEMLHDDDR